MKKPLAATGLASPLMPVVAALLLLCFSAVSGEGETVAAEPGVIGSVSVPGLAAGAYRVLWWDTRAGRKPSDAEATVAAGQPLILTTPTVAEDIAAWIVRGAPASLSPSDRGRLADEAEVNLRQHVLAKWFPHAVDRERGGFHQNFAEDWSRAPGDERSVVYQARLTWVAAQVALRYPEEAKSYRAFARHGLDFLAERLWDRQHGGFFWVLDAGGRPDAEKHVYGNAFGIYAAVAAHEATGDPRALDLARRAFAWLETHAHDRRHGGYFEALTREGRPILTLPAAPDAPKNDAIGVRYGFKSMNSHIHLLEAFTALYEIWPDATLRKRLREVFEIVRDRIAVEPGCLNLFFTPDWRAVPDHDSFGHDVETAYLLAEAATALGIPDDAKTWAVARRLVDHALEVGWDNEHGGFYDKGSAFGPATDTTKIWWVQAEGLNALLLLHERFGRETLRYGEAFLRQWEFIQKRQVDARHGGWYPTVTREGAPTPGRAKSDRWTEAYHQARALLNVRGLLEGGVGRDRRQMHPGVP